MDIGQHMKEHLILGVRPYNPAAVAITGGTVDGAVIGGTAPAEITGTTITAQTAAKLGSSNDVVLTRYAAKQVMISGDGVGATTNAGLIAGYGLASGFGSIWPTARTPADDNYSLAANVDNTNINAPTTVNLAIVNIPKFDLTSTLNRSINPLSVTAGTATTDVAALSVTRTNNNAAVVKGVEFNFTDTTSAAGFLPFAVRGGAAGTTDLFNVGKTGQLRAGGPLTILTPSTVGAANEVYFGGNGAAGAGINTIAGQSITFAVANTGVASFTSDVATFLTNVALSKTITAPGTTGAQTINKTTGRVNFAAAATSLVVTNSLVTPNSIITCNIATADATAADVKAVAGTGSFTIYLGAAGTAETAVEFRVTN